MSQVGLIQMQAAVVAARQYLELVNTQMLGAFVAPPPGSKLAVLLQELRDAEVTGKALLLQSET